MLNSRPFSELGPCHVAERLEKTPAVMRMPSSAVDLYIVRDFLTPSECEGIIALIEAGKKPSTLMQEEPDKEFRTSSSCHMDRTDPLVLKVERKISSLTGINPTHGETMQGQCYAVGQQFKPHNDYFHTNMPYWEAMKEKGGQRTWTVMICLNDVEEGGQTNFPLAGLCIKPRRGNAIAWNNLFPNGEPNPLTLHQGMPVLKGTKYIITKWYRERPWLGRTGEATYGLAAASQLISRSRGGEQFSLS